MRQEGARLSRRAFTCAGIGAGIGALGLSRFARAQAPVPDAPQNAALAARVDAASHLTLNVTINGQGPFRFVVDTGAERSVIADNVAAALQLPVGPSVTVDGISSRVSAPSVRVERLAFGPFTRRLVMPVLPRLNLQSDGYLGLDALSDARVTFDFAHRQVRIDERSVISPHYALLPRDASHDDAPPDTSAVVRAHGKDGHLRVTDSRVDSVVATAFVDTGAEVSVGNPALYDALKQRNKMLTELGAVMLSGVTGGQLPGVVIPVRRIHLQDILFSDGVLVVADPPDFTTWRLNHRPALLIGLDYLRQFAAVTIDYRDQAMRFELAAVTPHPTPAVSIEQMG